MSAEGRLGEFVTSLRLADVAPRAVATARRGLLAGVECAQLARAGFAEPANWLSGVYGGECHRAEVVAAGAFSAGPGGRLRASTS